MLNKELKQDVIKKFALNSTDTGSSEVQVAIFSERIRQINAHLALFPKDNHSRRGLLCLVSKRRTFLKYLKNTDQAAHNRLVASLKQVGYL